jgi:hypothetical protein
MNQATFLLSTDLDRTLLPNGVQPESPRARKYLAQLVSHHEVVLVFVSGRDKSLVEQAIHHYCLPQPDYVISDVGSNIYQINDGQWEIWTQWQQEIALDWNGFSQQQLAELLKDFAELQLQERSKQNSYKLSYYFPLHLEQQRLDQLISLHLQSQQIKANLIWSIDEPANIGLLDILPASASKLHALEFLRQHLDLPQSAVLFAGDSGNDLPVLTSTIPSVLVANASAEVREEAVQLTSANNNMQHLYLARGGLLGMNGNYSAGILEGVAHFHPKLIHLFDTDTASS